jgi:hypothetical protein
MRRPLGRLVALAPADTWFFLSVSAFAAVLTVIYWFWTYEWAGTILLFGFAVATGINGLRLLLVHPPRRTPEERVAEREARDEAAERERAGRTSGAAQLAGARSPASPAAVPAAYPGAGTASPHHPGRTGEQVVDADRAEAAIELAPATPDTDRPFLDETGRLPEPTVAPVAVALAVAFIATSIVLGPWLLVAAVLPLAWGAIGWIRDAGAEYRATDAEYRTTDAEDAPPGETPRAHDLPAAATSGGQGSATSRSLPERVDAPGDATSRP